MDLKEIMAIAGYPGLYRHISQGRNGIIVESLTDKKRMPAYSSMKISALEDIAVFIDDGELPLKDVFKRIFDKESGGPSIDAKSSPDDLKKYFVSIIPEYDKERVYVSDIKKIISWYNLMQSLEMIEFNEDEKNSGSVSENDPEDKHEEQKN